MSHIESYVFFDLETTGLPKEERNHTKITDLCFVVVSRRDMEITQYGDIPPVSKLCLLFNPEKEINPVAAHKTGLTRDYLKNCCIFPQKVETIVSFLNDLRKPICLVAHNGNSFDFKILLMEFENAKKSLPADLLCVDSLIGFRKLLKGTDINYFNLSVNNDSVLTDDEDDDWPDLNISNKDWNKIDNLSASFEEISIINASGSSPIKNESFNLSAIYKRLFNKDALNAHRAESDCLTLLESVVAIKDIFLPWADCNCKKIYEIKPYKPY